MIKNDYVVPEMEILVFDFENVSCMVSYEGESIPDDSVKF